MLTDTVLELTIETYQEVKVLPGQWALFLFDDKEGPFQRAYSIVDQDTDNERTMLVFAIKLSTNGRGSAMLRNLHIGNDVVLKWIFGTFVLQDTQLSKVFIWTWTWIVPLLNMAKYCMTEKDLFFSVPTKKDLFYEDRIKKIHGLWYKIYITQETIPGYDSGRIDLIKQSFTPTTEFYICWNPDAVDDMVWKLTFLGYKRIYTEKY